MTAPTCPSCGEPLAKVLDLAYGYWRFDEEAGQYKWASQSDRVDASPWTCAACLGELRGFHPQDAVVTNVV